MHILVINGPNMNMLGIRQPEIYGHDTYADLQAMIQAEADRLGAEVSFFQSNHEGALVDAIQQAYFDHVDGIIINLPAYLAGLGEDAYLTEFIPSPDAEIVEEDTPSGDDFGMDDMTMDEVPVG